MKKIYKPREGEKSIVPQHGYFRRMVRRLFLSWVKRHTPSHRKEFEKIVEKLQDIEDFIEIIARQMARKKKQNN